MLLSSLDENYRQTCPNMIENLRWFSQNCKWQYPWRRNLCRM